MRKIEFYRTEEGRSPVEDFFDSLESGQMQKVAWTLQLIKDLDIVPMQYFKKLDGTNNLWEVRVKSGNIQIRILGFWKANNFILLTNGFIKKTNKIPGKEIKTAVKRMSKYLERYRK
ncbi:MAG: type II toxin-antitoxin system RelE/ParE family toxin [bacterium]